MRKVFILTFVLSIFSSICFSQVSSQSKVYKSNPYVPPVDLKLLERVNTQKQNTYDNNREKLYNRIIYCKKTLEYVKGVNKAFITKDYNEIVNVYNGSDLSDYRFVNFISTELDGIEYWIDYVIKNPDVVLTKKAN